MTDPYSGYSMLKFTRQGPVLTITIDNPPANAVTRAVHRELSHVFFDVNKDRETRVVILTGAGESFSAGGDIKAMLSRVERGDHADWVVAATEGRRILYGLLGLEKPIIARVNGHAIGLGATLATVCDFSIALADAKIADPHVRVGLSAGDGGALIWPLLMGFQRARKYLMTGRALTGREAAEYGLVSEAAASVAELDRAVADLAQSLAAGPAAVAATKMTINLTLRRLLETSVEASFGYETLTYLSGDHREALRAANEKRSAKFTGE